MRAKFHPQLEHRWKVTPELKRLFFPSPYGQLGIRDKSIREGWYRKRVGSYFFIPLVIISDQRPLVAELDIRILWRDRPGNLLYKTGDGIDLDNRLSALLDALPIPQVNQLPDQEPRDFNEQHIFSLLEDDRLVTKLSISADQLTLAPEPGEPNNFADVSIDVVVRRGDGYEVPFGDF
jgi:hypothetical protein